jgi:hypothetical protein
LEKLKELVGKVLRVKSILKMVKNHATKTPCEKMAHV